MADETAVSLKLPIFHNAEDKALVLSTDQLGDIAYLRLSVYIRFHYFIRCFLKKSVMAL